MSLQNKDKWNFVKLCQSKQTENKERNQKSKEKIKEF